MSVPGSTPPAETPPPAPPSDAPPATPPPPPPPPPPAGAPGAPAPAAAPAGPDIADQMQDVMSGMMKRFTPGEMLILGGSLLILVVSAIITGILLDKYFAPDAAVVLSTALLAIIVLERMGQASFGAGYRTTLLVLGIILGVITIYWILYTFRVGTTSDAVRWLGQIAFWVGGIMAVVGGWFVFKGR